MHLEMPVCTRDGWVNEFAAGRRPGEALPSRLKLGRRTEWGLKVERWLDGPDSMVESPQSSSSELVFQFQTEASHSYHGGPPFKPAMEVGGLTLVRCVWFEFAVFHL